MKKKLGKKAVPSEICFLQSKKNLLFNSRFKKNGEKMAKKGSTKQSTNLLITALYRKAAKEKQGLWKAVAEKLEKPRRQRIEVNVSKLDFFSKKFAGKTFIVPGKVLGNEKIENKINAIALSYSEGAKKAITEKKGTAELLKNSLGRKFKPSEIIITA